MLKRLIKSVREFKLPSILTLIFIVAEVVIEVCIPFITALLISYIQTPTKNPLQDIPVLSGIVIPTGETMRMEVILGFGGVLVVMAMLSLACGGIAAYTCARASAGFARNLRQDIFDRIQTFSFENIDKFSSTSLVTRLTTDVMNVRMSFMMIIRTAIRAPLMLIFAIVMAAIMGGMLAMSFVVLVPLLAFGLFLISRKAMPAFRAVFRKYDKLNESIEENVRGMRVVKGFSREEHEKKKFRIAAEDICSDFTKAERIVAFNSPLMQVCVYANMIFVMLVGSMLVINSGGATVNVGQMSAMLTYGMQILIQLMMLSMIYVMITMSSESMKRIVEVLDEESALTNPANPVMTVKDGSIDFSGVSFKYSAKAERYALANVDLHIESGMTVGILGGTGSSKSTLVQLIPRLYDVTEGSVTVGGVDVREYDLDTLRGEVAMVLQKNLLFSGTIKENLRWGNENATDEEIVEACKLAQAHDFVTSFPDGYDTHIEQGGTNVSGGQKQRLCIARALLKKPKILILDDSTSAVDTKTDAKIRSGFRSYIPETTKIIIAQRVSSVQDADLILVMENGMIAAKGTHDELLRSCDIYREIHAQQTGGGEAHE
jgi:ATP-binding cassette subfamily B protein